MDKQRFANRLEMDPEWSLQDTSEAMNWALFNLSCYRFPAGIDGLDCSLL